MDSDGQLKEISGLIPVRMDELPIARHPVVPAAAWNRSLRIWIWVQVLSLPLAIFTAANYSDEKVIFAWEFLFVLWLIAAGFVVILREIKTYTADLIFIMLVCGGIPAVLFSLADGRALKSSEASNITPIIGLMALDVAFVLTFTSWGLWAAEKIGYLKTWQRTLLMILGLAMPVSLVGCGMGLFKFWLDRRISGAIIAAISVFVLIAFVRIHKRAMRLHQAITELTSKDPSAAN